MSAHQVDASVHCCDSGLAGKGWHDCRPFHPGCPTADGRRPNAERIIDNSTGRSWQVDDLALAAFDQRADMVFPQRQGGPHLALVSRSIVNSADRSAMPLMVQNLLDHVRRDAHVMQPGVNVLRKSCGVQSLKPTRASSCRLHLYQAENPRSARKPNR